MKWPFRIPWRSRQDHFEGILELFDDHVHIGEVTLDGRYVPRPQTRLKTKFEARGERLGHAVFDLAFRRV